MKITTFGTQKENPVVTIPTVNRIMHYAVDYDSTNPEGTIRDFVKNISDMVARYDDDKRRIYEIEQELNDLEHYLEILPPQTVAKGYKLYRKLAELRKERRACKNEVDLLQPVYEYFHATDILNRFRKIQGDTGRLKKSIDERSYICRTDVCDHLLDAAEKPEKETVVQVVEEEPVQNAVSL